MNDNTAFAITMFIFFGWIPIIALKYFIVDIIHAVKESSKGEGEKIDE